MIRLFTFSLFMFTAIVACKENKGTESAMISDESLRRHISTLASDEFLGRKPFTEGEEKTLTYLEQEIKSIGLSPGNGNSYFQEVPLVEITGHPDDSLILEGPKKIVLSRGPEFVAYTERIEL
jgi:hypothetical protein